MLDLHWEFKFYGLFSAHQRVLFRTEGAMNLINTHLYISKYVTGSRVVLFFVFFF